MNHLSWWKGCFFFENINRKENEECLWPRTYWASADILITKARRDEDEETRFLSGGLEWQMFRRWFDAEKMLKTSDFEHVADMEAKSYLVTCAQKAVVISNYSEDLHLVLRRICCNELCQTRWTMWRLVSDDNHLPGTRGGQQLRWRVLFPSTNCCLIFLANCRVLACVVVYSPIRRGKTHSQVRLKWDVARTEWVMCWSPCLSGRGFDSRRR